MHLPFLLLSSSLDVPFPPGFSRDAGDRSEAADSEGDETFLMTSNERFTPATPLAIFVIMDQLLIWWNRKRKRSCGHLSVHNTA